MARTPDEQSAWFAALGAVPDARRKIAQELRMMAQADGAYQHFGYTTPHVRNVWNAAADMLEKDALPPHLSS